MTRYWYCIEHGGKNEVDSYIESDGSTDFPRGTFFVYGDCCLVTGFKSREEALAGLKKYPCEKFNNGVRA